MNKASYLKQYEHLNNQINHLLEEKERHESTAEKITPTLSDMPKGGGDSNPRELAICKMIDCGIEANRLIDELHTLRCQVRCYINISGDDDIRLLDVLHIQK